MRSISRRLFLAWLGMLQISACSWYVHYNILYRLNVVAVIKIHYDEPCLVLKMKYHLYFLIMNSFCEQKFLLFPFLSNWGNKMYILIPRPGHNNQIWESFLSAQLTWLDPKMTRNRLEVDLLTVKWLDLIEIQPTFDLKVTRHFIIIDFTLHKDSRVLNNWVMVLPIKVSKFVG